MSDKKSFLNDISNTKPESFNEEEFIRQKKNLWPSIITASAVLVAALAVILIFSRGVVIPDMTGWTGSDAKTWEDGHNSVVVYVDEYSGEFESGAIISVSPETGSRARRSQTVTITVSKGADPNESIEFPDLKSMSLSQINRWIEDNSLTGITIKKENSSVFEKDDVINYEMIDGSESDFIRKHRVRVYVSTGPKILDETVHVPDFSSYDKAQILKWAHDNDITVEFFEEFSDFVDYQKVISQGIDAYTKMNRSDILNITMSLGKAIVVPDFTGMTRTEAAEAADKLGIQLQYESEISDKAVDTVLAQDIDAGNKIHSGQMITITLAAESASIIVPDLIGLNSQDASGIAGIYELKTFFMNKESREPKGTVIGMSIEPGTEISKSETVYVYISEGNAMVPDFSAMSKAEVDLWAQQNNVSITFIEKYSDKWDAGVMYEQNYINELLPGDSMLIVYCSLGKVTVKDFTGSSKLDVIDWQREVNSKGAQISLKFHYVEVQGMNANRVIDQSTRNDFVSAQCRIDVWITYDGQLDIPDMTAVAEEEFTAWCDRNQIGYLIVDTYSSEYVKGVLFGQNYTDIPLPEGTKLVIKRSLGKPKVIKLNGYTKTEVEGWVNSMNLQGAGFVIEYDYKVSDGVRPDSVVSHTLEGKWVDVGTVIKVYLSSGPK